jgi:hypothetical protein
MAAVQTSADREPPAACFPAAATAGRARSVREEA